MPASPALTRVETVLFLLLLDQGLIAARSSCSRRCPPVDVGQHCRDEQDERGEDAGENADKDDKPNGGYDQQQRRSAWCKKGDQGADEADQQEKQRYEPVGGGPRLQQVVESRVQHVEDKPYHKAYQPDDQRSQSSNQLHVSFSIFPLLSVLKSTTSALPAEHHVPFRLAPADFRQSSARHFEIALSKYTDGNKRG